VKELNMTISSGNPTHDANALLSEMLRMQDLGPPTVTNHSSAGPAGLFPPPVTAAQARFADVNHFRRLLSSALATGASPSTYLDALRSLGASLYP
jgi:hypothetical protein